MAWQPTKGQPYGGYFNGGPGGSMGAPSGMMGGPQMPMGGGFGFGDPMVTMYGGGGGMGAYRAGQSGNPFDREGPMTGLEKSAILAQILGTVGGLGLETYGAYRQGKQEDRDREQAEKDRRERAKGIAPVLREYLGT